jgi:hypothetical protein
LQTIFLRGRINSRKVTTNVAHICPGLFVHREREKSQKHSLRGKLNSNRPLPILATSYRSVLSPREREKESSPALSGVNPILTGCCQHRPNGTQSICPSRGHELVDWVAQQTCAPTESQISSARMIVAKVANLLATFCKSRQPTCNTSQKIPNLIAKFTKPRGNPPTKTQRKRTDTRPTNKYGLSSPLTCRYFVLKV